MVNTKLIADLPMDLGIKRTYKGYYFPGHRFPLWHYIQLHRAQHPNGDQRLLEFTGSS